MNISDKGIALIKKFEGCKLTTYKCPAGILTIGYGHTTNVNQGDAIPEEEADYLLRRDLDAAERCVNSCGAGNITQGQYDSLVSFVFNLGCFHLKSSTLLKELIAGNDMSAAQEFLKWTRASGKILPGLVARRKAEMELFLS